MTASEQPDAPAPTPAQADASGSPQSSLKPDGSRSRAASPVPSQASVALSATPFNPSERRAV
eukprot:10942201-Karenia_brevis.AAC.1